MSRRARKRVGPAEIVSRTEVRPSRFLRIQHFNARPRDEKFENEMQMYIQYKQQGIPASGPLTMPRRQQNNVQKTLQKILQDQPHPLSVIENTNNSDKEKTELNNASQSLQQAAAASCEPSQVLQENVIISPEADGMAPSVTSSTFSSPAHHAAPNNVRSASSVQLAVHNQAHPQELRQQSKPLFTKSNNIPDNIRESELEEKTSTHLNLSNVNEEQLDDCNKTSPKAPPSPLTPPTADSKCNDASFYPSLFTRLQQNNILEAPHASSKPDQPHSETSEVDKDLVIFFIHGVGGSSDIWCAQTTCLANLGYEIVAPDLIGHGLSSTPKDAKAYHFKEIAADLEAVFDLYCKRRNILIGHSYGASFATLLARNRPRRVTKLVLISGGPPTPLAPQPGVFTLPYCMLACIKPCLDCGFQKGAFHKGRTSVVSKEEAFNIPTYVLQHTMNGQDWPDGDELFHSWLTCPCLLIYGAQDQLVSLSEEEDMASVVFDCRLEVINDASHMVMIEAPEEVNTLLNAFIKQPVDMLARQNRNNNASPSQAPIPPLSERSKSRRSLKSAKSLRSLPHHLLSKSIKG